MLRRVRARVEPGAITIQLAIEQIALFKQAAFRREVLNDVLDLSKIEAGKLELSAVDFSLDALLGQAFALVADAARAKGLELVIDSDGVRRERSTSLR